jgi:hypothetical protein
MRSIQGLFSGAKSLSNCAAFMSRFQQSLQEKAIENIFLLVLGSRAFSHSLGHNEKISI